MCLSYNRCQFACVKVSVLNSEVCKKRNEEACNCVSTVMGMFHVLYIF